MPALWPDRAATSARRAAVTVMVLAGTAAVVIGTAWTRQRDEGPSRGDVEAMAWIRDHARPLDLVCAPDMLAARWIPVVAARPAAVPVAPGWPVPGGSCAVWLGLSGRDAPGHPPGAPSFRRGATAVWTASQAR